MYRYWWDHRVRKSPITSSMPSSTRYPRTTPPTPQTSGRRRLSRHRRVLLVVDEDPAWCKADSISQTSDVAADRATSTLRHTTLQYGLWLTVARHVAKPSLADNISLKEQQLRNELQYIATISPYSRRRRISCKIAIHTSRVPQSVRLCASS
ncbi:hypothetical protein B0H21DRAFT_726669 [Amylocystis lapponica]|nr:hypothetical protein B0H21DRAFT_726669 [Amylocystis lapponica]